MLSRMIGEEREEFEEAKEQIATFEDIVAQLTGELDDLKVTNETLAKRTREMGVVVKQAETRRAIEEAAVEKVRPTVVKAEKDRKEVLCEKSIFGDVTRDTWNANSAAAETALDVKVIRNVFSGQE